MSLRRILAIVCALLVGVVSYAQPKLGIQTWTCRNMNFEETIEFAAKHGVKYLQLYSAHLDPFGSKEETLRKKAMLDERGLVAYSIGVTGTSLDKEKNRQVFEFARLMGIKVIVVEPRDQAQWDNLEELVKEYDIKLAIHNHGAGTVYGDPATVRKILAERDARIGVSLDVGWVTAAGFDAAEVFRSYQGRVFDVHLKDKKSTTSADGKTIWVDTLPGEGATNFKGLFAAIKAEKWSGVMAIETDSREFASAPDELITSAKKFVGQQFPQQ